MCVGGEGAEGEIPEPKELYIGNDHSGMKKGGGLGPLPPWVSFRGQG